MSTSNDKGWEFLTRNHSNGEDYYDDDGSCEYIYSDGSGSYHGADGSWGTIDSDGSRSYYGADGSWGTIDSDGSGSYYGADGSWGTIDSDGSGSYYGSDGSWSTVDSDGNSSHYGTHGNDNNKSGNTSAAEGLGALLGFAIGGTMILGGWIKGKLEEKGENNSAKVPSPPTKSMTNTKKMRKNSKAKDWLLFFACFLFGIMGVHKFIERKIGMGVLYFFTAGLIGVGWIMDIGKYFMRAVK